MAGIGRRRTYNTQEHSDWRTIDRIPFRVNPLSVNGIIELGQALNLQNAIISTGFEPPFPNTALNTSTISNISGWNNFYILPQEIISKGFKIKGNFSTPSANSGTSVVLAITPDNRQEFMEVGYDVGLFNFMFNNRLFLTPSVLPLNSKFIFEFTYNMSNEASLLVKTTEGSIIYEVTRTGNHLAPNLLFIGTHSHFQGRGWNGFIWDVEILIPKN